MKPDQNQQTPWYSKLPHCDELNPRTESNSLLYPRESCHIHTPSGPETHTPAEEYAMLRKISAGKHVSFHSAELLNLEPP